MPLIRPFATDGAAPMMTTNMMALSLIWNSRMASGNHMIDGIVCSPVISEPMAARRGAKRETAAPTTVPISTASAKPVTARSMVTPTPPQKSPVTIRVPSSPKTVTGPGSTYTGFHCAQTTACQIRMTIAMASSLGHALRQTRPPRAALLRFGPSSSASRPVSRSAAAVSDSVRLSWAVGTSACMAGDLRAEPVGDLGRLAGNLGRVDAPGALMSDLEVLDDPARAAAQQHHPVAEADGLAHVVGDEEHGQLLLAPDPLELVVQDVAGHRVQGAERLVHQQDVGVLGQGAGEGDALAHAAGELVRALVAEAPETDDLEQLLGALPALGAGDAGQAQRQFHVAGDGQPREQGRLLEHQGDVPAADVQAAAADLVEAGDEREQRALAAAGRTQQADE